MSNPLISSENKATPSTDNQQLDECVEREVTLQTLLPEERFNATQRPAYDYQQLDECVEREVSLQTLLPEGRFNSTKCLTYEKCSTPLADDGIYY